MKIEKNLYHQISVIRKLSLEALYGSQLPAVGFIIRISLKPFPGHLVHPASVEERVFATLRDSGKIPV